MLEEPYELIAHVRLCGEVDRATGRLYPELGPNRSTPEKDGLFCQRFGRLNVTLCIEINLEI